MDQAKQAHAGLLHLGPSSDLTSSGPDLNEGFQSQGTWSLWNLLPQKHAIPSLGQGARWAAMIRILYILYTPREQVTEISFHQTPITKPSNLGAGITPTDFEKHFGQARLWPIIKPQLWCLSACCYHSSVHVKLIKKILQKLGVRETSGYLCSQYFYLAY